MEDTNQNPNEQPVQSAPPPTMRGPLNPYEIAAVTGGVPVTGDPTLDLVLNTSLRLKVAVELMGAILAGPHLTNIGLHTAADAAVEGADILISRFQGAPSGKKEST